MVECNQFLMPVLKNFASSAAQKLVTKSINRYSNFKYLEQANHLKIELLDEQNDQIADCYISLNEIPKDRFFSDNISLRCKSDNKNTESYSNPLL